MVMGGTFSLRGISSIRDVCFNLHEPLFQLFEALAHRRQLVADISFTLGAASPAVVNISSLRHAARDTLGHRPDLVLFRTHRAASLSSSPNRSIRSTTPTIAESIAAPASLVAAVDAPQPSCTIK